MRVFVVILSSNIFDHLGCNHKACPLGSGEISWNPKIDGAEPDLFAFYI